MTTFLLSHNLQVQGGSVPPLDGPELAAGLLRLCGSAARAEALSHPHWLIRIEGAVDAPALASDLLEAWIRLRNEKGHDVDHALLALGGRKDTRPGPGSPLEQGFWGVDVVETADPEGFLEAINWQALQASRPADGVFEVRLNPL
jgi:hypothetical protein